MDPSTSIGDGAGLSVVLGYLAEVAVWGTALALVGAIGVSAAFQLVLAADLGVPFRWSSERLATAAREGAARLLNAVVAPLGALGASPRPARQERPRVGPPILLVPEVGASRATMWLLRRFLVARGHSWVHVAAPLRGEPAAQAEQATRAIAELSGASGRGPVDVIAHGTSGLAFALALRHGALALGDVRRLVTLGTPWAGTRAAVFEEERRWTALRPGSHFLDGLAPCGVPTWAVWSPDDAFVLPASSAVPEGAVPVRVDGVSRVEFPISPRVLRVIATVIEQDG
jgi:triacylglycerol lipase